jgi:hypothetical protein
MSRGVNMAKRRMFSLSEKEFENLSYIADKTGWNYSVVIRVALQEYFENFKRKEWKASLNDRRIIKLKKRNIIKRDK